MSTPVTFKWGSPPGTSTRNIVLTTDKNMQSISVRFCHVTITAHNEKIAPFERQSAFLSSTEHHIDYYILDFKKPV